MTIFLAMMFGATVGLGIMAGFNNHSYNQGYKEGKKIGHREGFEEAYVRAANVVPFPQKEVPK